MTIEPKIIDEWQRRCIDIERASEAIARNMDPTHQWDYDCALRYAVRRCEIEERMMFNA